MPVRCYCPDLPATARLALSPEESRHLTQVRRVGLGEIVEVFDGRGLACSAEVVSLGKNRVELAPRETLADRLPPLELTLATAVPKGERFDWLVEKATELGVARLVPLATERGVVEPRATKLERLRKVIVEACKQCGRNRLMELDEVVSWIAFLDQARDGETPATRLLAHPGGLAIRKALSSVSTATPVMLAVGPEGGFSEAEVAEARNRGWCPVSLGRTILRIETAGLAGAAQVIAMVAEDDEEPA